MPVSRHVLGAWAPSAHPSLTVCRPNCAHWWPGRAPQPAGVRKGRGGGGQHSLLGVGRGTATLQLLWPARALLALGEAHIPGRLELQTPRTQGLWELASALSIPPADSSSSRIWARRCKVGAVGLLRRVGLGTEHGAQGCRERLLLACTG